MSKGLIQTPRIRWGKITVGVIFVILFFCGVCMFLAHMVRGDMVDKFTAVRAQCAEKYSSDKDRQACFDDAFGVPHQNDGMK